MSTTPAAARPPETTAERTAVARRAALASLIGTAIEWYDYFIFGTASVLVFGTLFFPSEDPLAGTLSAFAVFGVGFFARPVGGLVFGHIGDRLGRKGALVTTLMMMGVATFLMGLLPTTAQIGVLAPILLVLLRIVQGFGVGGEWGGAALVAVEYAPEGRRGAYGSAPQIGNAVGLVAATGVFGLVTLLPDEQLFSWGWRIPFLASIVLVLVGLFIRMRLTETPAFVAAQEAAEAAKADGATPVEQQVPLRTLLRTERRPLLIAMGLRLGEAIYGYILLTFVLTYAENYTDLDRSDVLWASCIAAGVAIGTYYGMGRLSDRIGRRPVYLIGAAVGAVMTWPIFLILDTNSVPLVIAMMIVAYAIGIGALYGVQPAMFSELFGTTTRYTGLSLAAQLPSMVVGVWPYLATSLLIATGGDPWPVVLITIVVLGIGAWCAIAARETHRSDLTGGHPGGAGAAATPTDRA
ncbi:MFS transporter [Pseudonocardia sp. HH130630-07]|uniref:MFS transporter n=1 Tax=Pseudonocardia sp. HH130630-07 TaxID=1690815 RepID=UPI000814B82F|nr:MFS transporter [Pseudonocardia sp. HH130630-07]ANY08441.1 MFS transporter [Pseudonocardia sp. HH130630-07]